MVLISLGWEGERGEVLGAQVSPQASLQLVRPLLESISEPWPPSSPLAAALLSGFEQRPGPSVHRYHWLVRSSRTYGGASGVLGERAL